MGPLFTPFCALSRLMLENPRPQFYFLPPQSALGAAAYILDTVDTCPSISRLPLSAFAEVIDCRHFTVRSCRDVKFRTAFFELQNLFPTVFRTRSVSLIASTNAARRQRRLHLNHPFRSPKRVPQPLQREATAPQRWRRSSQRKGATHVASPRVVSKRRQLDSMGTGPATSAR